MKHIQRACIPVLIAVLAGLLLFGVVSASEFCPWAITTVTSAGKVGQFSSLALDGAGNPAISYYDQTNRDLRYAKWDGASWIISKIDTNRTVGEYSSLALDSSGNPRISYYDQANADLKYAAFDGNTWVISTVDGSSRAKDSIWNLKHTYKDADSSGKWKEHRWDDDWFRGDKSYTKNYKVGTYSSLALDSSGNPRISYYDQTNKDLKYAASDGTKWVISTVDSSRSVGEYSSLSLDSSGNPWISYYDQTNADLKYAAFDGTRWVISIVDGASRSKDNTWNLKHTYKDVDSSGKWKEHRWDEDWSRWDKSFSKNYKVGTYSSLALDSSGNPRISYYDQTNSDLKYAAWDGAKWVISTIDSSRRVGEYSSLELDGSGNPRISYYDITHSDLKFAGWNSTNAVWITETVDSSGKVGRFSSLALDALGNPRISYYDQRNRDLKYTTGTGHSQSHPAPKVTSISPNNGHVGTSVSATITGMNFVSGTTPLVELLKQYQSAIIAIDVKVVSPTQITCTLPLYDFGLAIGQWDLLVIDEAGQTATLNNAFTVIGPLPPVPTIAGISPATGVAGTSVSIIDLAGNNFRSGATVNLTKAGSPDITATSVTVVSSTQITCTLPLPAPSATSAGQWDVVVTDEYGRAGSLPAAFTVTNPVLPVPKVTSISPASGDAGTLVTITNLAGTNFVQGTTPIVKLSKAGASDITATNVTVISSEKITCTFLLPAASETTLGQWDVVVQNTNGQGSMSAAFKVTGLSPMVKWNWAPNSWGDWVNTSAAFITSGVTETYGSTATYDLTLSSLGTYHEYGPVFDGSYWVHGTSANLIAGSVVSDVYKTFTTQGDGWKYITFHGILSGSNVPMARWLQIFVNGVGVYGYTVDDAHKNFDIPISITIPIDQINNPVSPVNPAIVEIRDGQSTAWGTDFTVKFDSLILSNIDPPTLSSISPTSGNAGTSGLVMTLTGANFKPGGTVKLVNLSYPDIIASSVSVDSPTQITCTLSLPSGIMDPTPTWDVNVEDEYGQTAVLRDAFTVNNPTLYGTGMNVKVSSTSSRTTASKAAVKATATPTYVRPGSIKVANMT